MNSSNINILLIFFFCFSSKLAVSAFLDYKQDTTINCASVVCDTKSKHPVRRSSSTRGKSTPITGMFNVIETLKFTSIKKKSQFGFLVLSLSIVRTDFTNFVQTENVVLQPGNNTIELTAKATRVGVWNFRQVKFSEFLKLFLQFLPQFKSATVPSHFISAVD